MSTHWSSETGAGIQQFFEILNNGTSAHNAQNVKGKCKICGSIVSFSRKATSNLVTHVKRKHPEHYEDYARNKPQYVSLAASCSVQLPTSTVSASSAADWSTVLANHVVQPSAVVQHSLAETKHRPHSETPPSYTVGSLNGVHQAKDGHHQRNQHPQLNSALLRLVCGNLLPLHFIDSNEFQEFINVLKPIRCALPSQTDLSEVLLPQKKLELETNLIQALRGVDSVCLTLDIWSHSQRWSFLGITAHFVAKDWGLGSAMLACKRFRGRRYTMEYIVQQYEEAVWAYGLQDKVVSIVTHNIADAGIGSGGCDMLPEMYLVEAFGNGSHSRPNSDQMRAGKCEDELGDTDNANDCDEVTGCCVGDQLSELECVDFTSELFLPGQEDCFSHSLHMAVKEGLQDCQQLANILLQISSVLSTMKSAVGGKMEPPLVGEHRRKPHSSCWRWNAQLNVVRFVLKVLDDGDDDDSELRQRMLEGHLDRHLLAEVLEILEPIEEASNFAESQDGVSISYVVPCVRGLVHHLESYRACHLAAVVEQLRASVLERLLVYNERRNYLCGAMLDPRFKARWAQPEELTELASVLSDEAEKLTLPATHNVATSNATSNDEPLPMSLQALLAAPTPDKMAKIAGLPGCDSNSFRSVKMEVDEYLANPCLEHDRNPLHYWRDSGCSRFPTLARLARHLLPICASSAKVEQIFDAEGTAFRSSQCWLSSKMFETMMSLKCNRVFWK